MACYHGRMSVRQAHQAGQWRLREPAAPGDCRRLAAALGVHELVARLLCQRGFSHEASARSFLEPRLADLHDPARIPGCGTAAERIVQAAKDRQPLVIYGDYDVDGITAASILWHTLKAIGAEVATYIPHRMEEGYGLNTDALLQFAAQSPRPLVVSVDCGITAIEPALAARRAGLELIITDHHQVDDAHLPDVDILVHPRLPGGNYPFGDLCGAGVAFKLAWQIARTFCGSDRVSDELRHLLLDLISLAALGTIADVVPLVDENRIITRYGLGQIQRTRFVGLNALIEASRLSDERIDAYHVGFVLAPRINACGRMGHARDALHLLTEADAAESQRLAQFLTTENERRRRVEREIFGQACAAIAEKQYDSDDMRAFVLAGEGWHQGVIGIVASRLVDTYHRPVIMLNIEDGVAHGSARSVDGVDIHEVLTCGAELFDSYGGHAMAAGMVLPSQRIDALREVVVREVNQRLDASRLVPQLTIDATATLDDMTFDVLEQLRSLAPFGRANPSPVLQLSDVQAHRAAERVGGEGRHLRLWVRQGQRCMSTIGFGLGDLAEQLPAGVRIDLAFTPKLGTWQGRPQIELHVKDVRLR